MNSDSEDPVIFPVRWREFYSDPSDERTIRILANLAPGQEIDHSAVAESPDRVVIKLFARDRRSVHIHRVERGEEFIHPVGNEVRYAVTLEEPLGERVVIDGIMEQLEP